jgi:hypothetical protein
MPEQVPEFKAILLDASKALAGFSGRILDVLEVSRPPDLEYAIHLSKVVSKLSPIIGNMIEYGVVSFLNDKVKRRNGKWVRQDPGFPDTIFQGSVRPTPGIEIKTWFPLATEITARFKDSITHFAKEQTNVAMLAWVPEFVIFGRPKVLDVWIDTAGSVALARDTHYHNPPDYLVFEPEDTSNRARNLQQTNTNGYKFQGTPSELDRAKKLVDEWGPAGRKFSHSPKYQAKLKGLLSQFSYRLDTNFAKMDRIEHTTLEKFKQKVCSSTINGYTINHWAKVLGSPETTTNKAQLQSLIEWKRDQIDSIFNEAGNPKKPSNRR